MTGKRFMIKEAADIVNVESHVLRYWEDELELTIPRNEMGHRYYTKENIDQFMRIKELKEQGYQLKVIRMMLHNEGLKEGEENIMNRNQMQPDYTYQLQKVAMKKDPMMTQYQSQSMDQNADKLEQFQSMMTEIVRQAINENNEALGQCVGKQVGDKVLKEMNYLMREADEQEEERYKKLDEAIRNYAAAHPAKKEKESRFFRKKQELKPNQA